MIPSPGVVIVFDTNRAGFMQEGPKLLLLLLLERLNPLVNAHGA